MELETLRKEYLDKIDIKNHSKSHIESFNYFINKGIHLLTNSDSWYDVYRDSLDE